LHFDSAQCGAQYKPLKAAPFAFRLRISTLLNVALKAAPFSFNFPTSTHFDFAQYKPLGAAPFSFNL
jgi:hypothetical protein